MPQYQITAPDGTKYQVTAPDGASQDQVMAYVQSQHAPVAPDPGPEKPLLQRAADATSDFVKSAAQGVDKVGYNIERGLESVGIPAHMLRAATGDTTPTAQAYQQDVAHTSQSVSGQHPHFETAGRVAGEVGATLPLVAGLGPVAGGAVSGALTTDADTVGGVAKDAALGAVGGKLGDLAVRGAAKVIAPAARQAVQTLTDAEVPLTTGQRLGGLAKTVEDKLTSVPGLGDAIQNRRLEGVQGLNKAVANRVLAKVGQSVPDSVEPGHELTDYVATTLGNRYDTLLPRMVGNLDGKFLTDVDKVKNAARGGTIPDSQFSRLETLIKTQVLDKAYQAGGQLDGQTVKGIQEQLGDLATGLRSDPSYDNRALGGYVSDLRDAVNGMLERSNPALAPELRKTNAAYADYVKLRTAQKSVTGDQPFSPKQLQTALRQTDKSAGKGNYARGKSSMQDLADAASETLPSKVPDSGTAGRVLLLNPLAWPGAAAGAAAYSKPGQAVLNSLVARQPSANANAIAELVRSGAVPAASLNALTLPALVDQRTQ